LSIASMGRVLLKVIILGDSGPVSSLFRDSSFRSFPDTTVLFYSI